MATDYKNLSVWGESIQLSKNIYSELQNFPKNQTYSLVDQMQRAAISIPSNIAEWSGRGTNADFVRFLQIAKWSSCELEAQIILSRELWFLQETTATKLIQETEEIQKMLSALISKRKSFDS